MKYKLIKIIAGIFLRLFKIRVMKIKLIANNEEHNAWLNTSDVNEIVKMYDYGCKSLDNKHYSTEIEYMQYTTGARAKIILQNQLN